MSVKLWLPDLSQRRCPVVLRHVTIALDEVLEKLDILLLQRGAVRLYEGPEPGHLVVWWVVVVWWDLLVGYLILRRGGSACRERLDLLVLQGIVVSFAGLHLWSQING